MIFIYLMVKVAKSQKVFVPSSKSMQEIIVRQIQILNLIWKKMLDSNFVHVFCRWEEMKIENIF